MADIIACKLSPTELMARKANLLKDLKPLVVHSSETTSGFIYTFQEGDSTTHHLLEFIKAERSCCPFLSFQLTFPPDGGPVQLELSGRKGVKDFIKTELEL
jgi:hypothetical protein